MHIEGKEGWVEIADPKGKYCLARVNHMNMDDMEKGPVMEDNIMLHRCDMKDPHQQFRYWIE